MLPTEPPAKAALPPIDRRSLLLGAGLGAGLAVGAPALAHSMEHGFTHGVASGEPAANSVLLWTRHVGHQPHVLTCELSTTQDFTRPAWSDAVEASPERDWCAKAYAIDLEAGTWYYYRFVAPDGSASDIGRTRTLPEGPVASWKMAVFSCSNMRFGWFNAYAHAAEADELDCTLHLGDYFYEYAAGTYPSDRSAIPGRLIDPSHEIVALADYRLRYASYRRDPDLRRLHQLYPMISGWDDHESANDSWATGAENHQPDSEGEWSVRKAAAMRAYREWMPVTHAPWAAYEIGDLATLFRLETRLEARSQPFDLASILKGSTSPQQAMAALAAFRDGDYADPARTILGERQESWLADGLRASRGGGKPWQVLVQQVIMGKNAAPSTALEAIADKVPDFARSRVLAAAMASRAGLPLNMDAWDGYPAARERLFNAALEADANILTLTGDTHNAWAFNLAHEGDKVGVELGGQSVTSPGAESYLSAVQPQDFARAMVDRNAELAWCDTSQRGYLAVELTPQRATGEFRFTGNPSSRSSVINGAHRVTTLAGARAFEAG